MAELLLRVCDPCDKRESQRVEATETLRLTINDEPLRIDVCGRHSIEINAQLDSLSEIGWRDELSSERSSVNGSRGRKTADSLLSSAESRGCPVCVRLFSTRGNMRKHCRTMHERDLDDFSDDEQQRATEEARARLKLGDAQ